MSVTREAVTAALSAIQDPGSGQDIVQAGMAKAISIDDAGAVNFVIEVDPALGAQAEPLRAAAQAAVEAIPGVARVSAVLTAHSSEPTPSRRSGEPWRSIRQAPRPWRPWGRSRCLRNNTRSPSITYRPPSRRCRRPTGSIIHWGWPTVASATWLRRGTT